jgi:transglutaminase-like putative cysteine protease
VPGHAVLRTPELQWLLARPLTDRVRFEGEAWTRWQQGPVARATALPLEYRELPPGFNPRTMQLATDLMRASRAAPDDKAALVDAALARLRTGGYRYTLEPGVFGPNTADEFWFDRREGFCEHIASAFAVLMRAMDIPARIVTGYQGGEPDSISGDWVVRNSDAHAWVEVWLQGRGWVRVDPTAAVAPGRTGSLQRLQPPPGVLAEAMAAVSPDLAVTLRAAWEALNNAWNQRVLNYTQGRQMDLLRSLGFSAPSWEDLARVLAALATLAAAAGACWAWWERHADDPWLRLLARARRRLARAGLSLPGPATPRAMAEAVRAHWPGTQGSAGPGEPLARWLLRLEAQRYARAPAAGLGELRREWRQLAWPR